MYSRFFFVSSTLEATFDGEKRKIFLSGLMSNYKLNSPDIVYHELFYSEWIKKDVQNKSPGLNFVTALSINFHELFLKRDFSFSFNRQIGHTDKQTATTTKQYNKNNKFRLARHNDKRHLPTEND
jgi:hypothetical protein